MIKVVEVRQLLPEYQFFDGTVTTAVIHAVRRAKNIVILRSPIISLHSGLFNIKFFMKYDKEDSQLYSLARILDNNNVSGSTFCGLTQLILQASLARVLSKSQSGKWSS